MQYVAQLLPKKLLKHVTLKLSPILELPWSPANTRLEVKEEDGDSETSA